MVRVSFNWFSLISISRQRATPLRSPAKRKICQPVDDKVAGLATMHLNNRERLGPALMIRRHVRQRAQQQGF
jgi:hypothetical protein